MLGDIVQDKVRERGYKLDEKNSQPLSLSLTIGAIYRLTWLGVLAEEVDFEYGFRVREIKSL